MKNVYQYKRSNKFNYIVIIVVVVGLIFESSLVIGSGSRGIDMDTKSKGGTTIVIVGASYAAGWSLESLGAYDVVNKGVGGSETRDVLERFQLDVIDAKPKAVIIWGFINDIFRSNKNTVEKKIENAKENIMKMTDLAKNSGVRPILATEVTITSPNNWKEKIMGVVGNLLGKQSYSEYINGYVSAANDWLRDYANKKDVLLLDIEPLLSDEEGERKRVYAVEDGSHLSKEAYKKITEYVEAENLEL